MSGNSQVLAQFTEKEKIVAQLLMEGLRNREIASQLGMTVEIVKHRLREIYDKSGTWSRLELALWWLHHQ